MKEDMGSKSKHLPFIHLGRKIKVTLYDNWCKTQTLDKVSTAIEDEEAALRPC